MRKVAVLAAVAAILFIGGHASAGIPSPRAAGSRAHDTIGNTPPEKDLRAIEALRARWLEAANCGDVGELLETYGAGAVLLQASAPPMLGDAAIAGWHRRWEAAGADVRYELDAHVVHLEGGLALEEWKARVTVTPELDELSIGGDVLQFRQSGVRVYRKESGGTWRIDRETWSPEPRPR